MSKYREITNAEYAAMMATILCIASQTSGSLARGMWNPHFCEDKAETDALDEIQKVIDHYQSGGYRAMRYEHGVGYVDTSKEVSDGS